MGIPSDLTTTTVNHSTFVSLHLTSPLVFCNLGNHSIYTPTTNSQAIEHVKVEKPHILHDHSSSYQSIMLMVVIPLLTAITALVSIFLVSYYFSSSVY